MMISSGEIQPTFKRIGLGNQAGAEIGPQHDGKRAGCRHQLPRGEGCGQQCRGTGRLQQAGDAEAGEKGREAIAGGSAEALAQLRAIGAQHAGADHTRGPRAAAPQRRKD